MSRILAVDDEVDILYTLQAIGEVANFMIYTATNGYEAVELIQKEKFDLVIVDFHMPQMNGLELTRRIREMDAQVPILVLTVDESMELAEKFFDTGATDFALKPIRAADLISRVKLHLRLAQSTDLVQEQLDAGQFDLPKGLTPATLQLVIDYLSEIDEPITLNQVSKGTGLAYQTVHRYVDYLLQIEYVKVELVYGKIGRPIQRYKLKG